MAIETKIQWTDSTFNPWRGCTKVSDGCKFCYAERQSGRNPKVLGEWGPNGTRVLASPEKWNEPRVWSRNQPESWDNSHLVFVASLADVFEEWEGQITNHKGQPLWVEGWERKEDLPVVEKTSRSIPYTLGHARTKLWNLIRETPNLTYQILTKRPENITKFMPHGEWKNVWLGTSVENQDNVWRLDALNDAPQIVPVKFCSAEPLLGPINILSSLGRDSINWVIVGGESGGESKRV